jgi:hypothetical protein
MNIEFFSQYDVKSLSGVDFFEYNSSLTAWYYQFTRRR